jgi:hypothetical protein
MLFQKVKRKYSPNVVASFLSRIEVLASRIDRFMPMFAKLIAQGIDKESVRGMLKSLSRIFIKEPHFVWAVKQYRGFLADRTGQTGAEEQSQNFQFIRQKLADFTHVYKNAEADNFRPILDYKIKENESAHTLLNNLLKLEQDVLDKREDEGLHRIVEVDPETEKTFMKFADKWEWVLLDREYCAKEKEAMDHCGNADYRYGDRLLSLREPVSKGKQRPHLTFILHNGFLGEMKGYKNNKPSPKFHKYIIPLLKDNRIKSLLGGGYKPENNFHLEDLKEDEKTELLKEKPKLDIHNYLQEATDVPLDDNEYISSDKKSIVVEKCENISDFCKENNLPDLEEDSFLKFMISTEMSKTPLKQ